MFNTREKFHKFLNPLYFKKLFFRIQKILIIYWKSIKKINTLLKRSNNSMMFTFLTEIIMEIVKYNKFF